jgi:hypothetical protein
MIHLMTYESYSKQSVDINDSIKYLKKIPKDLKNVALGLLKQYSKAENGKITGLELTPDLKEKINKKNLPNGFDMGIDKDGYFIHTHRARSKSYKSPLEIPIKDIKFINSTG